MRLGHLATGFAIRRGLEYRRNGDLKALGADAAFQRWGTDITIMAGSRELRLLSVHLRTGCWGEKQDGESRSRKACATLRGQMEGLKAWADARRAEGTGFVILGDFNRRLTLSGDWAWRVLSPASAPLGLLTAGEPLRCDPRGSRRSSTTWWREGKWKRWLCAARFARPHSVGRIPTTVQYRRYSGLKYRGRSRTMRLLGRLRSKVKRDAFVGAGVLTR